MATEESSVYSTHQALLELKITSHSLVSNLLFLQTLEKQGAEGINETQQYAASQAFSIGYLNSNIQGTPQ